MDEEHLEFRKFLTDWAEAITDPYAESRDVLVDVIGEFDERFGA